MSEIRHILLVPAEGDPHLLLKEGSCGARPPKARRLIQPRLMHASNGFADPTYNGEKCVACGQPWPCDTPGEVEQVADAKWVPWPHAVSSPCALVLAWDGEPVAEVQPYIERAGIDYALLAPFVTYALKGMDIGQGPWPGTLVLVDAEGQEVSDG
jgi:hypothetical protein